VALIGRAFPIQESKTLNTPINGIPCVFYELVIEKWHFLGKTHWRTVYEEESDSAPFYLEDSSGKLLVYPKNSDTNISSAYCTSKELSFGEDRTLKNFMEKRKLKLKGVFSNGDRIRYTERHIPEGKDVYVLGLSDGKGNISDFPNKGSIIISDKSKEKVLLENLAPAVILILFLCAALFFILE